MTSSSITLTGSTVTQNTGTGVRGPFGGNITVTGSTVTQNTGAGVNLEDGHLTVTGTTASGNGTYGVRTTGHGTGTFALTDSVVSDNGSVGVTCSNCGDLQVSGSVVSGNDGGGIYFAVDQDGPAADVAVTITDSVVVDNTRDGPGAGLHAYVTELQNTPPLAQIVVLRSTFADNEATGASGEGGAVWTETGDFEVRVTNSTLTGNTASVGGGAIHTGGAVFLEHATVADNTAPAASQLLTGADLSAFGSIVAAGAGAAACDVAGSTVSGGYNVGDDGSCDFTGTGDQNAVASAELGPLQDNGGPTPTRLPLAGSPAVNAVPVAACTVAAADQRGVARPQGTACEAGAVEVTAGGLANTGSPLRGLLVAGSVLVLAGVLLLVGLRLRRRAPHPSR
jgi:predicted outer membrane repeat protein